MWTLDRIRTFLTARKSLITWPIARDLGTPDLLGNAESFVFDLVVLFLDEPVSFRITFGNPNVDLGKLSSDGVDITFLAVVGFGLGL